jgi:UDP-N-acetyl-D-glucosamine dehydrogenase
MPAVAVDTLEEKIASRTATVGVIGLGYVGLPLVAGFGQSRFRVLGLDVDPAKVSALQRNRSYIAHFPSETLEKLQGEGRFAATTDPSRLRECDVIVICVPTPLNRHREPDLSYIESTASQVAAAARPGQLVILESTTYPGTTEEILLPALEGAGLTLDRDFYLAYSPEREDPANPRFNLRTTPKVVGGVSEDSGRLAALLYECVVDRVVRVADARTAEATKLVENIFRSVNIALVNELKMCFDKMGIEVRNVLEAAATKPFGFMKFDPGPGLGGHCIPIDPFYLTWKAREYGVSTRFIELAGEINTMMPHWVTGKLADALNDRGRSLKGSRILVVGVAYKSNIDDIRESPAMEIIEILQSRGALVAYHDPHVPHLHRMRRHDLQLSSVELEGRTLEECDAVMIVTDHDRVDYEALARKAPLIVDTRGALERRGIAADPSRVVRA